VRGSAGKQYPQHTKQTDRLTVFDGYLLRTADMISTEAVDLFGVRVFRYNLDPNTFKNASYGRTCVVVLVVCWHCSWFLC
jgi:hypothetical protein